MTLKILLVIFISSICYPSIKNKPNTQIKNIFEFLIKIKSLKLLTQSYPFFLDLVLDLFVSLTLYLLV